MNEIIRFLTRFLKYTFLGKIDSPERLVNIDFWQVCLFMLAVESRSYSLMRYVSSKVGCSHINPVIDIAEADITRASKEQPRAQVILITRAQVILIINWFLIVICAGCFAVIIIYALFFADKPVPDLIQNAFFTILGWFGGALGAFFEREPTGR